MGNKFQVGQVWKSRDGQLRKVSDVHPGVVDDVLQIYIVWIDDAETHTADGFYYGENNLHDLDLLELVTNTDGTPAVAASIEDTHKHLKAGVDYVAGELRPFEPQMRESFVDNLITSALVRALDNGITFNDVADSVRDAVALRDELVK